MATDVIFLLGAGASKDAGLPLMADLAAGFLPWLSSQEADDEAAIRELFEGAVKAVSPPTGPPNIELVLQLLGDVQSSKIGMHSQTVDAWKPPIDASAQLVSALSISIREAE